ncbi:UDP-N-acetylmuramoyl-L-alanine--D-glutamate ligase [Candidatus Saccharibacteria bacterium]|nr:UDP-N-acetylmuramoyl-L-alanine--D-glutamate ligase [Candidatus Saccharibacteria bacterium]
MKIAILGYGLEGKSVEKYFKDKAEITIFNNFKKLPDTSEFDLVFRTPSVKVPENEPKNWTSVTKYFFENCPCKIIGVTGTKGKGTTCTMTRELLEAFGKTVYLVGNIGEPAIDSLDKIKENDVVIYELSSFQLWDLDRSPDIAVVLRIEPDHLNVHKDFDDYVSAKANIAKHQYPEDSLIFFRLNPTSKKFAQIGPAQKIAYPYIAKTGDVITDFENTKIAQQLFQHLPLLGKHNQENLEAALLATYAYLHPIGSKPESYLDWLEANQTTLEKAIQNMTPLPHHIEFVRELNNVKYYDDSFCTVFPALDVALKSFDNTPLVLIAGGSDKGVDLGPAKRAIFDRKNLLKAVLIGETAEKLAENENPERYVLAGTDFKKAIETAKALAEEAKEPAVVLLSPVAASFDMFKSYKDRGDRFKAIVNSL